MPEDLIRAILSEIARDASRIRAIRHGKVLIVIQDGKVVRVETTEGRQVG